MTNDQGLLLRSAARMHRMAFIDLEKVNRWYGTHQALKDVSLHLEPGRIGLLGPNGAGKSTLLKLLLGLLPPSSGRGRVLDHDLVAVNESSSMLRALPRALVEIGHELANPGNALRRAIGYMPE